MTTPLPRPLPLSIFRDDEPVIQSHSLLNAARLPGVQVPLFGDTSAWDFNGVVRRNANLSEGSFRMNLNEGLASPEWNLTAREVAMVMANPRHEVVIDAGVHLPPEPFDVQTIIRTNSLLRTIVSWGRGNGMPDRLDGWRDTDFRRFTNWLATTKGRQAGTVMNYTAVIKRLHEIGPAARVRRAAGGSLAWQERAPGRQVRGRERTVDPERPAGDLVSPGPRRLDLCAHLRP